MSVATDVAAIRTAIVTTMEGVSGVGRVHRYMRHVTNRAGLEALFKDPTSGRLFGWQLSMSGEAPATTIRTVRTTLNFDIHGYMAVNDADDTEELLAAKVFDLMEALKANQHLGLATISGSGPLDWLQHAHVSFGDVFCNYVRLTLPVWLSSDRC